MPRVQITLHENHAEETVKTSPEMTKKDAEAQAEYVRENIVSHFEVGVDADGAVIRKEHKPDATGEPGTELHLGWISLINGVVDDVAVVA